ncbi:MAG: hypothetical protein NTY29_13040, partial [Proteobacteria bacterium]|nr:hypothetical protein [Pseudomonadota bacterium]
FGKAPVDDTIELDEVKEPPLNMLVAMGITAFLCIFLGIYPRILYDILPYKVTYSPYTVYSVSMMLQLLIFAGVGYSLFVNNLYGERTISLDTDWFYRRGALYFIQFCESFVGVRAALQRFVARLVDVIVALSRNPFHIFSAVIFSNSAAAKNYNPDAYRQAIGNGVMYFLCLFSLFCIIFFLYS